ncbi:MAG: transcriptional regulator [Thiotrichaceae bacterium]|nr:MAG: transcriptional regulator [Thiotrichaceae bacterium]
MDQFDRFYALHNIFKIKKHPVSLSYIMDELECATSTAKRLISRMRLYLDAPIEYSRQHNGYYYDYSKTRNSHPYELPGLWFNTSELHALLTTQTLLENVDPGIYSQQLSPLKQRIQSLLEHTGEKYDDISQRIRILSIAQRTFDNHIFRHVTTAVLQRKKLKINYAGRQQTQATERSVSPQRLIHYRYNWYLDAWCHLRKEFRTFAVERITFAKVENSKAKTFSQQALNEYFASAFGIFSGKAKHTAVLHFTPERARWVAEEQWHPQQQSKWLDNGSYELCIPYGNATELIMDILKYGTDVEVIKPASLKNAVKRKIHSMAQLYQ